MIVGTWILKYSLHFLLRAKVFFFCSKINYSYFNLLFACHKFICSFYIKLSLKQHLLKPSFVLKNILKKHFHLFLHHQIESSSLKFQLVLIIPVFITIKLSNPTSKRKWKKILSTWNWNWKRYKKPFQNN